MAAALLVLEGGEPMEFAFEDLMRYHGPGSPGGVAIAFKVMERGFPLLAGGDPPQRREISVRTPFGGPGARDAFEMVTRAVTGERFTLDPALCRPELGFARERFVFVLAHRGEEITLTLRDGYVTDEFVELARTGSRSAEQERRLTAMKADLAARVMAAPAESVFDVE